MSCCDEILDLLSARLDGPLSPEETAKVEAHLSGCQDCRDLARDLAALHGAMAQMQVTPPSGMTQGVMAQIAAQGVVPFPKKSAARHWQAWGAAAAVLVVVLAGTFAFRQSTVPPFNSPAALLAAPSQTATPPAPTAAPRQVPSPTPTPAPVSDYLPSKASVQTAAPANQALTAPMPPVTSVPPAAPSHEARAQRATLPTATPPAVTPPVATPVSPKVFAAAAADVAHTPEVTACRAIFEHLKSIPYPDLGSTAPWDGARRTDLNYTLAPVTVEGEDYLWHLDCKGLSANHRYYEFYLYAEVTGGEASRTVQGGWYAVGKADGTILTYQDDTAAYDAAVTD